MIFNPRRGGGEKEYTITPRNNVVVSATKLKPGHVFEARSPSGHNRYPKMTFVDPDTGKSVTIQNTRSISDFVMPCADVTISY